MCHNLFLVKQPVPAGNADRTIIDLTVSGSGVTSIITFRYCLFNTLISIIQHSGIDYRLLNFDVDYWLLTCDSLNFHKVIMINHYSAENNSIMSIIYPTDPALLEGP